MLGKAANSAITQARKELATGNISLDGDFNINGHQVLGDGKKDDGRSKAEITPAGDFLVDGKAIAITPAQRALLVQYRRDVIVVADAGMLIGVRGADLAGKAMKEAVLGALSGDADKIEQKIEGEAKALEADAHRLCGALPALLASQDRLAASLPEFAPYATMDQDDVEDCLEETVASK